MNQTITNYSEEEIIRKILEGETALFELLIRRHNALLYRIGRSHGFGHEDTKDLLQETHIAAYRNLQKFESRSSYKTWVARIMVNKCLYKMKYGSYKYEVLHDAMDENAQPMFAKKSDNENVLNKELSQILERSLESIPLNYRTVFILREVEGFNVAETAALLNLTEVNVKVRLSRAKTMLQEQLEKNYSRAQLYDFNLIYCDEVVHNVMAAIEQLNREPERPNEE
jgi:RNA polymerase sigma factor (sigma-70 family)